MKLSVVNSTQASAVKKRRPAKADKAEHFGDQVNLSPTKPTAGKAKFSQIHRVHYDVSTGVTHSLVPVLFLSDLDGTWLSPNAENRKTLEQGVLELKQEAASKGVDLQFGYISARPLERIQQENLPPSDWSIADNGGYIYKNEEAAPAEDWEDHKRTFDFNSKMAFDAANDLLKDPKFAGLSVTSVGKVVGNAAADACPDMAVICIENDSVRLAAGEGRKQLEADNFDAPSQVEAFAQAISARLQEEGAQFQQSPIYPFHGKPYVMFDLASVNKGDAIAYLKEREKLRPDHIIIAGDGGNDIAMMLDQKGKDDGRRAIVVGENSKLREAARGVNRAIIQSPEEDCSLGVLAGLRQHVQEIIAQVNQ